MTPKSQAKPKPPAPGKDKKQTSPRTKDRPSSSTVTAMRRKA